MNCNFLESEYFYHTQLRGQGESEHSRPISWFVPLSSGSTAEPTEQASATAEQVPSAVEPPQVSLPGETPPVISDVISEPSFDSSNVVSAANPDTVEENAAIDGDTGRYILPHRSTRGVPPKRYSPEKIGTKSRYSIANLAKANLTEMARAFATALYEEEELPRNAKEAMRIPHWWRAMMVEMKALMKNKTWEKCHPPDGARMVGCRWVFTIKRRPDGSIE